MAGVTWGRLPPAGTPLAGRALAGWRAGVQEGGAVRELARWLGAREVRLFASGREALRVALAAAARRSGRREVVIPAYTCYSVPSAAVAAGLRVRLVDVEPDGRLRPEALARVPLERAAAIVACNLFGLPDPLTELRPVVRAAGALLVDDAAQALGAADAEGKAGARGDVGVLSFGRGKPLAALGGGALVLGKAELEVPRPPLPRPWRWAALARALAHDAALAPPLFALARRLPGLHVGESRFDPRFRRGAIDGASLALLGALLPSLDSDTEERWRLARSAAVRLEAGSAFRALRPRPGARPSPARLALLAPSGQARDRALAGLDRLGAGASRMYPLSLDALPALALHRAGSGTCPGARELAARLLTLPLHLQGRRGGRWLERVGEVLSAAARG